MNSESSAFKLISFNRASYDLHVSLDVLQLSLLPPKTSKPSSPKILCINALILPLHNSQYEIFHNCPHVMVIILTHLHG